MVELELGFRARAHESRLCGKTTFKFQKKNFRGSLLREQPDPSVLQIRADLQPPARAGRAAGQKLRAQAENGTVSRALWLKE